eukprot:COSAG01_NODE_8693_length_2695_cov_2.444915_1_plen_388_part_00
MQPRRALLSLRRLGAGVLLALTAMYAGRRLQVMILGRTHDGGLLPPVDAVAAALHGQCAALLTPLSHCRCPRVRGGTVLVTLGAGAGDGPAARANWYVGSAEVVDLHCDALLGGRDLLLRSSDGHVDVPRLLEGQVALTVFTAVTQFPWIPRQRHNAEHSRLPDAITGLALAQGWPRSTWGSFMQRALYQARELRGFVARSGGQLVLVRSRQELQRFRAERRRRCGGGSGGGSGGGGGTGGQQPIGGRCPLTAAVLGVEGLLALELERDSSLATAVQRLRQLHGAGVRLLGLNHFTDTALSGSAHGEAPDTKGLSALGSLLIPVMESMGFVLDLAHASEPTIRQVLALATKPLLISHTGLKRMCAPPPPSAPSSALRRWTCYPIGRS